MSKEFFNQKAEKWDELTDHNHDIIQEVIDTLPNYSQPSILDVGGGTGVMISFLKERYGKQAKITEIDYAEKMIQISQKKHKEYQNIEYIVGDIYNYNLSVNNYDLIICYSVFPHFPEKEKIMVRFNKLLKNNGDLLIFHSQSRKEINNMHKEAGKEVKADKLPPAGKVVSQAYKINYNLIRARDTSRMYLLHFRKEE